LVPGLYIYVVHRWSLSGLRSESRLAYKVARYQDGVLLPERQAEQLINQTALQGKSQPNAAHLIADQARLLLIFQSCNDALETEFAEIVGEFEAENTNRCDVQQKSAENYARRRQQELTERIQRFRTQGKLQIIPAIEGLLNKVNRELELKIRAIDQKRETNLDLIQLAAGIFFVE
jgi:signal-transduction protein with cAMP-binding, CBS, and nucleotidyltransferase domain